MNIHLNDLTDLVAISLGEFPEWKGAATMTVMEGVELQEFVRPLAEPLAMQAVLNLPLASCSDIRDLSATIVEATDWGEDHLFACELPPDFLRLHSLWMPDWPCALNEENAGDGLRLSLGLRAPSWMLDRALRPMLRIVAATDTSRAQLWFGPTSRRRPLQSAYIARPRWDPDSDTLLDLQPEALMPLVDAMAARIRTNNNS